MGKPKKVPIKYFERNLNAYFDSLKRMKRQTSLISCAFVLFVLMSTVTMLATFYSGASTYIAAVPVCFYVSAYCKTPVKLHELQKGRPKGRQARENARKKKVRTDDDLFSVFLLLPNSKTAIIKANSSESLTIDEATCAVASRFRCPPNLFYLSYYGKPLANGRGLTFADYCIHKDSTIVVYSRSALGGMKRSADEADESEHCSKKRQADGNDLWTCNNCSMYSTDNRSNMTRHLQRCTELYTCACGYSSTYKKRRLNHQNSCKKTMTCANCGSYSTDDRSHMTKHLESCHNSESYAARKHDLDDLKVEHLPSLYDAGKMCHICSHCNARLFKNELNISDNKDKYGKCCMHGKISLPVPSAYPDPFRELIEGKYPSLAQIYRHESRQFNNSIAMAAFTSHNQTLSGVYSTFRVQGQAYVAIGDGLEPESIEHAHYFQVFFTSADEPTQKTLAMTRARLKQTQNNQRIYDIVRGVLNQNPLFQCFRTFYDEASNYPEKNYRLLLSDRRNNELFPNNITPRDEVAGVFRIEGDGEFPKRAVVVSPKASEGKLRLTRISGTHQLCTPLTYPLLWPGAEPGWNPGGFQYNSKDKTTRSSLTHLEHFRYNLFERDSTPTIVRDGHLHHGRLTQQWMVDEHIAIESERLDWVRQHQTQIRADLYKEVNDAIAAKEVRNVGHVVLPSSYTGSPRHMKQQYEDAMAIVRHFGKPDLFITFTCNPNWIEIQRELKFGEKAYDRPDLCARVFQAKLAELLNDLIHKHIFGKVVANVHVIEFQKRGLSHAHLLIILSANDKPRDASQYDKIVSAEIPDPTTQPSLHKLVLDHMVHYHAGRCKELEGSCSEHFPKPFCNETTDTADSYPEYRRRSPQNGGRSMFLQEKNITIDNSLIVPYNAYLLMKYQCHINVEICTSITSVKYLYKYVYKGYDHVEYRLETDMPSTTSSDEITKFVQARYVSASEAVTRAFGFNLHNKYPTVIRLPLHLENEQSISISMPKHANEDEAKTAALDALDKGAVTPLTSFFHICSMDNDNGALARTLHYDSMPKHFIWNHSKKCWERRTHLNEALTNIGRIRTVQPTPASMEQFYARMLLYVVKGPTSFANLRTYKGKEHSTYKEACFARGLIEDDNEWTLALEEAAQCQSPAQMRQLFVVILTAGDPVSPLALFDKFWKPMAETWAWKRYHASPHSFPTQGLPPVTDSDKQALLFDLAHRLSNFSKPNLSDYGLPLPDESKLDKTISNFKQDEGLRVQRTSFTKKCLILFKS